MANSLLLGRDGLCARLTERLVVVAEWILVATLAVRFGLWVQDQDGLLDVTSFFDFPRF